MRKTQPTVRSLRRILSRCLLPVLAGTFARADRTLYVSPSGDAVAPYLSWDDAANSIHDAVSAATNTDVIVVADGTYTLTNEVTISTAITLRSENGAEATFVNANGPVTATRGFYLQQADAVIEGITISNGIAATGGGVYLQTGSLRDCIVCFNTATDRGGGIFATGGSILNCLISTNASTSNGGGVYFNYGPNTLLRNSRIVGNQTAANGAGTYCNRGGLIENCLIVDNVSTATGASQGGGGAYLLQGGRFRNCTISGNTGHYGGGLLTSSGSSGTGVVHNTILYFNTATYYQNMHNLATIVVSNSCYTPSSVSGTLLGSGNQYADPLFAAREAGDYRLAAGSPCINAGIGMDWMAEAVDLDGRRRIDGLHKVVDLGCYEHPFVGSVLIIR